MKNQLTLGRALAMVGGTRKEAKLSAVRIVRQKPGSPEQETIRVDYSAIKRNQKPDFLLRPFDVIDVPEASILSPERIPEILIRMFTNTLNSATTLPAQVVLPR